MSTTIAFPAINQEDRLLLAIEALKTGQSTGIRATARSYDVPQSTLTHRINGRTPRRDSQLTNHKLIPTEEATLVEWILSMDKRGLPPRAASVRRMADFIACESGKLNSRHHFSCRPMLGTKFCQTPSRVTIKILSQIRLSKSPMRRSKNYTKLVPPCPEYDRKIWDFGSRYLQF